MYHQIAEKNPDLPIYPVTHPLFSQYGRIVNEYDFTPWIREMEHIPIPKEGNVYVAEDAALSSGEPANQIARCFFADMPIQVGYCNGNNSSLNAMEYHKTPELNIAVTSLVLLLADIRDIRDNKLNVQAVKGFFLPAGTACEIYGTTLHFAPCKVSDEGFKCIVALYKGTNLPINPPRSYAAGEEQLLWMKGKWLIAHRESVPASKGAYVGIVGDNIRVHY